MKKHKFLTKWKTIKTSRNENQRNKVLAIMRAEENRRNANHIRDLTRDKCTAFFMFIKKMRVQSNKLSLKDLKKFNNYFADMGEIINRKIPHSAWPSSYFRSEKSINLCPTDGNEVYFLIANLNSSKSCSFDGTNNELLQVFSPVVSAFFSK